MNLDELLQAQNETNTELAARFTRTDTEANTDTGPEEDNDE